MSSFCILKSDGKGAARVGKLKLRSGEFDTPGFFLYTQRGSTPHLTVDNVKQATSVNGVQLSLHNAYDILAALSQPNAPGLNKFLNLEVLYTVS